MPTNDKYIEIDAVDQKSIFQSFVDKTKDVCSYAKSSIYSNVKSLLNTTLTSNNSKE
jgi:hypothetical protein